MWMTYFLLTSGLSYRIFMMMWVLYNECRQSSSWLNLERSSLGMSMSLGLEPAIKGDCKFKWLHHLMRSAFWLGQRYLLQIYSEYIWIILAVWPWKLLDLFITLFFSSVQVNFSIYCIGWLNKSACVKDLDYMAHNNLYNLYKY